MAGTADNGRVTPPDSRAVPVTVPVDHGTAKLLPDVDRSAAWLLTVDGAPQSYVDLADPGHLEFEYTRRLAHLLDAAAPRGAPVRALHLGGGGLTLPRYTAFTRPGSPQLVAEADGGLARLVASRLPLPEGSGVTVRVTDAREALDAAAAGSLDVLIADVFAGARTPAHLTTQGYAVAAARALAPGGLFAVNLADAAPFTFLRSQLATVATAFRELCLIAEPAVLRGRRFGNTILAASQEALPIGAVARGCAADPFPARILHGAALARFAGDARPVPETGARPSPQPPPGAFSLE